MTNEQLKTINRDLERENAKLRELAERRLRSIKTGIKQNAELRRDRERLERENAKLKDDYEEVLQIRGTMEWQYEQDKQELAELRRDRERLDWLLLWIDVRVICDDDYSGIWPPTTRAAIDQARKEDA